MFEKIIVIGCPGAGKSTFARKLRDILNLPLYYLDMIWHKADKTTVSRDEFDGKLREIISSDKWIIDGNYGRTLDVRFEACDTVFFLDYPKDVCLSGAGARVGKAREDMPWIEEEFDPEFKEWIEGFREREMVKINDLIEKYKSKNIIILSSRDEADEYISNLPRRIL